jgi:hypothetical protein
MCEFVVTADMFHYCSSVAACLEQCVLPMDYFRFILQKRPTILVFNYLCIYSVSLNTFAM